MYELNEVEQVEVSGGCPLLIPIAILAFADGALWGYIISKRP